MSRYSVKKVIPTLSLVALTTFSPARNAIAASAVEAVTPPSSMEITLTPRQEKQVENIQKLYILAQAASEYVGRKNDCERALQEVAVAKRLDISGDLPDEVSVQAEQAIMDSLGALNEIEELCLSDEATLATRSGWTGPQP